MAAAASGNSTLGIPANVGADFMQADKGNPAARGTGRKRSEFSTAMKRHGLAHGEHKRHPATSHTTAFGPEGNKYGKR